MRLTIYVYSEVTRYFSIRISVDAFCMRRQEFQISLPSPLPLNCGETSQSKKAESKLIIYLDICESTFIIDRKID